MFVPTTANPSEVERLIHLGVHVHRVGTTYSEALGACYIHVSHHAATQIEAYGDPIAMAGAATVAREFEADGVGEEGRPHDARACLWRPLRVVVEPGVMAPFASLVAGRWMPGPEPASAWSGVARTSSTPRPLLRKCSVSVPSPQVGHHVPGSACELPQWVITYPVRPENSRSGSLRTRIRPQTHPGGTSGTPAPTPLRPAST